MCIVIADSWGTLAERVWIGGFTYVTKLCVDGKFLQAVAVLPYAIKWHTNRCPAVQKASTKAMQISLCRLIHYKKLALFRPNYFEDSLKTLEIRPKKCKYITTILTVINKPSK